VDLLVPAWSFYEPGVSADDAALSRTSGLSQAMYAKRGEIDISRSCDPWAEAAAAIQRTVDHEFLLGPEQYELFKVEQGQVVPLIKQQHGRRQQQQQQGTTARQQLKMAVKITTPNSFSLQECYKLLEDNNSLKADLQKAAEEVERQKVGAVYHVSGCSLHCHCVLTFGRCLLTAAEVYLNS
jgi:hypothetical protein